MQQIPQIEEKCLPRNIIEPIDSLQIITSTESAQKASNSLVEWKEELPVDNGNTSS